MLSLEALLAIIPGGGVLLDSLHRVAPTTQNYLAQNVSSIEAETPLSSMTLLPVVKINVKSLKRISKEL